MRVELMTMWYNEEDFAHFFLKHYSWVDKINLILDADTNDKTVEIAAAYPNVEIEYFKFPDMMDDLIKVQKFNNKYKELKCDWVILVDSDEFIFNKNLHSNFSNDLENELNDVIHSQLWNVYRHNTEYDLNIDIPISSQRRHGQKEIFGGNQNLYLKPSIVRGQLENVEWKPGNHFLNINKQRQQPQVILPGAHWAMADVDLAVKRRIYGRKLRQSQFNLIHGMTVQHHNITEEQIREECKMHLDDPQVF